MKKIVEFLMQAFFAVFIMGVLVSLCGVGEFCAPLLLIGGITAVVGFMLTVVFATIEIAIENR